MDRTFPEGMCIKVEEKEFRLALGLRVKEGFKSIILFTHHQLLFQFSTCREKFHSQPLRLYLSFHFLALNLFWKNV